MIEEAVLDNDISRTKLTLHAILIFIFSMLLFLTSNYCHEFIVMEPRWALFVKYMYKDGITFYPTLFGKAYPDYPGLFTILSYWLSLGLGTINTFTITFPTSVAAAFTVMFTYLIGAKHSVRMGIYSSLLLLATVHFYQCARQANPDMFVAVFTIIAFYFAYNSIEKPKSKTYLWIFPICLFFGFFFRGPIGLIIPASVICLCFLLAGRFKSFIILVIVSIVLLIVFEGINCFAAYLIGGTEFLKSTLNAQVFGRMGSDKPIIYYFLGGLGGYSLAYPFAVLALIFYWYKALSRKAKNSGFKIFKYLVLWWVVIFAGMSIPGDKHLRYVLAAVPAVSLMAAYFFNEDYVKNKIHKLILNFFNLLFLYLPLIMLVLLWIGYIVTLFIKNLPIEYPILLPSILLIVFSICVYSIIYFGKLKFSQMTRLFVLVISLFILEISVLQPIILQTETSMKFINTVQKLTDNDKRPIIFYRLGPDGDNMDYIANSNNSNFVVEVADKPEQLEKYKRPYIILAKQKYFNRFPQDFKDQFKTLAEGKVGHTGALAMEFINAKGASGSVDAGLRPEKKEAIK